MSLTLIWGKGFRLEDDPTVLGEPYLHVVGIDGDHDWLSASSVSEMEALAEQHGISKDLWPIYPDCEIHGEVPLEDAMRRSAELRNALQGVDPRVVEGDYWLSYIWRLLRDGNAFFIMRG